MVETRRLIGLAERASERLDILPAGPVAVALSGGADSAACAFALLRSGRTVRAIHVHHGLPGSDRLRQAAESIAERLTIGLTVIGISPDPGPSFEDRARSDRYGALLGGLAGGELLATGHTLDDQAETVLMNLVRGSGLDGLAGIPAARGPIVRPMLGMTRSETRELAGLARLPWRDDPANEDLAHLRNRIRREVLPGLQHSFHPGVPATLARTADVAAAEIAVLEDLATAIPHEQRHGAVRFPVGALLAVARPVGARAVRSALRRIGADHPPSLAALERVWEVATNGGRAPVGSGISVRRDGPWLVLEGASAEAEVAPVPAPRELTPPGTVHWGDLRLELTIGPPPAALPLSSHRLVHPLGDGAAMVRVRAARSDDRIGAKRVGSAMREAGVPGPARPGWPVVLVDDVVVWVPGVRRAGSPPLGGDRYLCGVARKDTGWEPSAS